MESWLRETGNEDMTQTHMVHQVQKTSGKKHDHVRRGYFLM